MKFKVSTSKKRGIIELLPCVTLLFWVDELDIGVGWFNFSVWLAIERKEKGEET